MINKSKRVTSHIICLSLVLSMTFGTSAIGAEQSKNENDKKNVKNVILMIPDGMSVDGVTLARWYNGGEPLAMDEMASGLVKTYWAGGPITDSAPAGTAYATGYKSSSGFVSVLPNSVTMPGLPAMDPQDAQKPVATILEAAKMAGKSTGIIATCEICHATPADFAAHGPSRHNYDNLSEQMVYNNVDVVLGGGSDVLKDTRKDSEDMISVLKNKGYDYFTTRDEMMKFTSNKMWGLFANMAMAYDWDRDTSKEPSLAEMTQKAIDTLSKNETGFFLMVEGSKIDWAAHANDPSGIVSDVLAFDKAVKVALDFAKENKDTVVLATTDHGNGGISIGNTDTKDYDKAPLSRFIDPLKKAKFTGEGLQSMINENKTNIADVMASYFGITNLTDDEIKAITSAKLGRPGYPSEGNLNSNVGPMISKRSQIGWTTGGHTGEDVVLYSYHPNPEDRLTGVVENTDIAKYIAKVLNVSLSDTSKKLFVPIRSAFEAKSATVTFDNVTDNANPVIIVTKGSDTLKLFVNKSIAELNGVKKDLSGCVVVTNKAYVPQDAVDMIK